MPLNQALPQQKITITAKSPIPPIGAQRAAAQCRSPGRLSSSGFRQSKCLVFMGEAQVILMDLACYNKATQKREI